MQNAGAQEDHYAELADKEEDDSLLEGDESPEEIYELWVASLNSEYTKTVYEKALRYVVPPGKEGAIKFLKLARDSQKAAQFQILKWVIEKKKQNKKGVTVHNYLSALRSLVEFSEYPFKWRRIVKALPAANWVADDRPPTIEEIRKLYAIADLRMKFVVSSQYSGGWRVGAFSEMKVGDILDYLVTDEIKIGVVLVYPSDVASRYVAFISSEALQDFHNYIDYRKRAGEVITSESPAIRDSFNMNNAKNPRVINAHTISADLRHLWRKAGITNREFKADHGFRKAFHSRLEASGLKTSHIKRLKGNKIPVDDSYFTRNLKNFPPLLKDIAIEYSKIVPLLTINEAEEVKQKLKEERVNLQKMFENLEEKTKREIDSLKISILQAQIQAAQSGPKPSESQAHKLRSKRLSSSQSLSC